MYKLSKLNDEIIQLQFIVKTFITQPDNNIRHFLVQEIQNQFCTFLLIKNTV